ncbi:MAG: hypothetical protein ACK51M_00340, partial [Burkholderiales bacterium]
VIASLQPARDVLALASTEVDVAPIAEGSAVTVMWRGKPVFVRSRTPAEVQDDPQVRAAYLGADDGDELMSAALAA